MFRPASANLTPRIVYIAAGLLACIIVAGTAAALMFYRSAALANGEWHLRNIAVALAEQVRQGVLTVDLAVRATADWYSKQSQSGIADPRSLYQELRERVEELPHLRTLLIIGPEGRPLVHSDAFPAPAINYADRDYFTAQRDARDGAHAFLGAPLKGRFLQEWTFPLSRSIRDADGRFAGVVAAGFSMPYFHDIYRTLELGPHGRVRLFRTDGVLLTTFPEDTSQLGNRYAGHALFTTSMPRAAGGVLRSTGFIDERSRLIGYQVLTDYPLVIAVSLTTDYVLREWRQQSLYVGVTALAAVAFILIASLALARQLRVARDLAGEVAESEHRWLAAMEAAGHGVWEWDVNSMRTIRSAQYHRMLGYDEGELGERREAWLKLIHPEDREGIRRVNQSLFDSRLDQFSTELRLRCKSGNWMWVLNRGMVVSRDEGGRPLKVLGTITDITEAQRAEEALRDSEARLNAIIGSAMDAIITIDRDHKIILFNTAAERIFGCPARGAPGTEAIGSPLERFIPERFRAGHVAHIERFAETGVSMRRMGEKIELLGLRANGEEFPIDASISQVEIRGEKYYTVILRDVTAQHRALAQLHDSEARLNAIIESAMDAIITVDERQNIILFNVAAERIFGCPANVAVGSALDRFIPQRYRQAHRAHIERFAETGVTMRRMGENIVLAGLRADGEEFPIDASISQVVVGGRRFYTVILRDITERQRAATQVEETHRELRELYGVMNEVREAERIRIARELHDELAQWLTALKMDVSWLAARLPKSETRLTEKTGKMKEVVDATVAAVRRIASDLRPVMIDDLGLVPAIEHLLHEFSQRTSILVSLDARTEGVEFHDPVATAVYRMVQEALTNVARHAEATKVEVSMAVEGEALSVSVRDNGRGIDEGGLRKAKSYGVLGIRERAQTLGGSARIYRAERGGTIVEIRIPMRAQKRAERAA